MKRRKFKGKLDLNKTTIYCLNTKEKEMICGGEFTTSTLPICRVIRQSNDPAAGCEISLGVICTLPSENTDSLACI